MDRICVGGAETGTYRATAPNPHVELSGTASSAFAIAQVLGGGLSNGYTVSATVCKDAAHWETYKGATYTTGTPNILDLSTATLIDSLGSIGAGDVVTVFGLAPLDRVDRIVAADISANNTASILIPLDSLVSRYEITIDSLIPATTDQALRLYASTDGGSTYLSSGHYQAQSSTKNGSVFTGGLANAGYWDLCGSIKNSGMGLSASINLHGHHTGKNMAFDARGSGSDNANIYYSFALAGQITQTTAINKIKLQMASGNITSGRILVHGIL